MPDMGRYGTVDELAAAERINSSYVLQLLRLTPLAPDMTEDDAHLSLGGLASSW